MLAFGGKACGASLRAPDDAVRAAQFVQAKHVIPCHYDTFPPIRQDADAFAEKLHDAAEIDCTVMAVGDEFTL